VGADFREAGERISGAAAGRISRGFREKNLQTAENNKIGFGPLDDRPARCGMILATAGIGPKGVINI
jgi:hypothetical protein